MIVQTLFKQALRNPPATIGDRVVAAVKQRICPQTAAAALCAKLDKQQAADPSGEDEAAQERLEQLGTLLGGVGDDGFVAVLDWNMQRIETDKTEKADPRDYHSGRGGNDPDRYMSGWLEDAIEMARNEFCRDFMFDCERVMNGAYFE